MTPETCKEWEEIGLLYVSGEIPYQLGRDYISHTRSCSGCRLFLERYLQERSELFTPGILEDAPSQEIDLEILRVCSRRRFMIPVFSFFRRHVLLPACIFLIGFVSAGYIIMNIENSRRPVVVQQPVRDTVDVRDSLLLRGDNKGIKPVNLHK
jgi:hypothetical protein